MEKSQEPMDYESAKKILDSCNSSLQIDAAIEYFNLYIVKCKGTLSDEDINEMNENFNLLVSVKMLELNPGM
jgi:hypothetical protein